MKINLTAQDSHGFFMACQLIGSNPPKVGGLMEIPLQGCTLLLRVNQVQTDGKQTDVKASFLRLARL